MKKKCRGKFDGSNALFEACWRRYSKYRGDFDIDTTDVDEVLEILETIAAEKVNNPKSRYYIYG